MFPVRVMTYGNKFVIVADFADYTNIFKYFRNLSFD